MAKVSVAHNVTLHTTQTNEVARNDRMLCVPLYVTFLLLCDVYLQSP